MNKSIWWKQQDLLSKVVIIDFVEFKPSIASVPSGTMLVNVLELLNRPNLNLFIHIFNPGVMSAD